MGEVFKQMDLSLLALLVQSRCYTGTKVLTSEEDLEVGEVFKHMDLNHDGVVSKQVYLIYYPMYYEIVPNFPADTRCEQELQRVRDMPDADLEACDPGKTRLGQQGGISSVRGAKQYKQVD